MALIGSARAPHANRNEGLWLRHERRIVREAGRFPGRQAPHEGIFRIGVQDLAAQDDTGRSARPRRSRFANSAGSVG